MFRVTSVSRQSGVPTTKQFRSEKAAREVFDHTVKCNVMFALLAEVGKDEYGYDVIVRVIERAV